MIVAVASQKGGTGKSSTSISLAAGLARLHEKKVLIVDIDSQANTSKVLLPDYQELRKEQAIYATILDRKPLPVHQTSIPRLSIVPSHILLSNTDVELTTAKDHREFCAVFRILNRQGELNRLIRWASRKGLPGPRRLYEHRLTDAERQLLRFAFRSPHLVRWVRYLHKFSYLIRKTLRYPARGSASVYRYGECLTSW